jgi:hypothetical protein
VKRQTVAQFRGSRFVGNQLEISGGAKLHYNLNVREPFHVSSAAADRFTTGKPIHDSKETIETNYNNRNNNQSI